MAKEQQNRRDDLFHTDVSEQALRAMIVAYQQRMNANHAGSDKLDEVLAILKGETPKPKVPPVPFDCIVDDWAANKKPSPAPDTVKTFRRFMRDLAEGIGHDNAVAVTPEEIENYRNAKLKAGKADTTMHNELTGISRIFNWAVFKGMITTSPMKQVVIGEKPDSERDEPYTIEQVSKIVLSALTQPDEIRIPILIAAYGDSVYQKSSTARPSISSWMRVIGASKFG